MTEPSADNPYAAPEARVAPPADDASAVRPYGMLAGRWRRLGGALIDGLAALLAFAVIGWIFPALNMLEEDNLLVVHGWAGAVVGFAIFLVLQGWLLHTRAQTIGKRLLGMRIVRTDGSRPGTGRLIGLRYGVMALMSVVPTVGPIISLIDCLLIFRASRQCLHDQIADTVVITA